MKLIVWIDGNIRNLESNKVNIIGEIEHSLRKIFKNLLKLII